MTPYCRYFKRAQQGGWHSAAKLMLWAKYERLQHILSVLTCHNETKILSDNIRKSEAFLFLRILVFIKKSNTLNPNGLPQCCYLSVLATVILILHKVTETNPHHRCLFITAIFTYW